eukprot:535326_1
MTVVSNKVVSIYDPNIKSSFYSRSNFRFDTFLNTYYGGKSIKSYSIPLETFDLYTIIELFEDGIDNTFGEKEHVQIIVDRTNVNQNKEENVYILVLSKISNNTFIKSMHKICFMSLTFTVSPLKKVKQQFNIVQCHLFYGLNEHDRMRFYPEHLTTIIPRFFRRKYSLNYYDNIQKIYDDSYKHGFAVDLYDPIFNKHYKKMTGHEHVSINYNRLIFNDQEEKEQQTDYAYKDVKYHTLNKRSKICNLNSKLEIEECPFVDYIIYTPIREGEITDTNYS